MNHFEIYQKLQSTKKPLISLRDLMGISGLGQKSAYLLAHRLKARKFIYPLFRGKYALSDDPFLIPTALYSPSYYSFSTALYLHNVLDQTINEFYVVTTRKVASPVVIFDTKVHFIIVKPALIYGYHKIARGNSFIFLADMEKIIVDAAYLTGYLPTTILIDLVKKEIDITKLENYVIQSGSEAVCRRVGYLLDRFGYTTQLHTHSKVRYQWNPQVKEKGIYNPKWGLYLNEQVLLE